MRRTHSPEGLARAAGGPLAPAPLVSDWAVAEQTGSAPELLSRGIDFARRTVNICHVTGPALVLGSTQRRGTEPAVAGVDVIRRRSGGGAVWLESGAQVWVDVVIPADDPLWQVDVGRAFWWLGHAWVDALAGVGRPGAAVHHGGLCTTRWSREVCFAGLGSGEVTVPPDSSGPGPKVVGISQRRTRAGALFQCSALLTWDPDPIASALGLPDEAADELAGSAVGVNELSGGHVDETALAAGLVALLRSL